MRRARTSPFGLLTSAGINAWLIGEKGGVFVPWPRAHEPAQDQGTGGFRLLLFTLATPTLAVSAPFWIAPVGIG